MGEAIEHICLKFLSRDLIKGQKQDVWFTWIVSVTSVLNVGEKFIRALAINSLLQLFSKSCKYLYL